MRIGKRLEILRIEKSLSGNYLAKLAGVSQSTVNQAEHDTKSPTIDTLSKMCYALNISLKDFFMENRAELPETHRELYKDIISLNPNQQEILIRIINHIKEKRGRPTYISESKKTNADKDLH